jgi:hypothetical protein
MAFPGAAPMPAFVALTTYADARTRFAVGREEK